METRAAAEDFDFLIGKWRVHHRRLKERLAGSDDWQEFEGTSELWKILGGAGTIDDNVIELPDGTYRAATVRALDPRTQKWSIWWVDGRTPGPLDPPMVGGFADGVGSFFADEIVQRQADPGPIPLVRHHREHLSMGAELFPGRRRDLGGQLGDELHAPRLTRLRLGIQVDP